MADNTLDSKFAYTYPWSTQGFERSLAEKGFGLLVGYSEGFLRNTLQKTGMPVFPPLTGYLAQLGAQSLYKAIFEPGLTSLDSGDTSATSDIFMYVSPIIAKSNFIKSFHNDFANANKFYVEFIRMQGSEEADMVPKNKAILSTNGVDWQEQIMSNFETVPTMITNNSQHKILLNYMVDSVQFPNFTSKKAIMTRMGQDFSFVNNQQYDTNLTINFTYDMRGNIDRFLHYMAQQSKYFNVNRNNKFMIRISTYKPIHTISHGITRQIPPTSYASYDPAQFILNTKTFYNVQLDTMQNYQLDNKSKDFISRAVTFTFMGIKEDVYDNYNSMMIPELMYSMYENFYKWAKPVQNKAKEQKTETPVNYELDMEVLNWINNNSKTQPTRNSEDAQKLIDDYQTLENNRKYEEVMKQSGSNPLYSKQRN